MKTSYTSTYKVQKKDTLPSIGRLLETNWNLIYHLNRLKIGPNSDILQVSQELLIPSPLVVSCWNEIMASDAVKHLTQDWNSQSSKVAEVLQKSTSVSGEGELRNVCDEVKVDGTLGSLVWRMRIREGWNPWCQMVKVILSLLEAGIRNEVYEDIKVLG